MEEKRIISVEISELLDRQILSEAEKHGHSNRSAVVRMALNYYFEQNFAKIRTSEKEEEKCQTCNAER